MKYLVNLQCKFLLIAMLAAIATPATAQTIYRAETRARLAKKVRLASGASTLDKIAQALSAQTGLTIQPAAYLTERQITAQLTDITAEAALNSLAELNGLAWHEAGAGHIVIEHLKLDPPTDKLSMINALRATLPLDLQRYLGLGWELEDYTKAADEETRSLLDNGVAKQNNPSPNDAHERLEKARQARSAVVLPNIRHAVVAQQKRLADKLDPIVWDGKPHPYATLTPTQQQAFVDSLMLQALFQWSNRMGSLLDADLLPWEIDPAKARFVVVGTELRILSGKQYPGYYEEKFVGGGVTGLKPSRGTNK